MSAITPAITCDQGVHTPPLYPPLMIAGVIIALEGLDHLRTYEHDPNILQSGLKGVGCLAMNNPEFTIEKQRPAHLFKPGQSGNPAGRPKGAKSRLTEDFLRDLAEAWQEHGPRALAACARDEPSQFCRIIAGLMPKDITLTATLDASAFVTQFRTAQELLGNVAPVRQARRVLPGQPRLIEHE